MFQARIAITTMMVIAVTHGFGFLPGGSSSSIEFAGVPARDLVANVLVSGLPAATFIRSYVALVRSGRSLFERHGLQVR